VYVPLAATSLRHVQFTVLVQNVARVYILLCCLQIHPHDMELSTVSQLDRTMDLTTVRIDRIQVTRGSKDGSCVLTAAAAHCSSTTTCCAVTNSNICSSVLHLLLLNP
jgi:hypothetical protein